MSGVYKSSCHEKGLRLSIEEALSSAVQRFGLGLRALKEAVNGSRHRFSYHSPSLLADSR